MATNPSSTQAVIVLVLTVMGLAILRFPRFIVGLDLLTEYSDLRMPNLFQSLTPMRSQRSLYWGWFGSPIADELPERVSKGG